MKAYLITTGTIFGLIALAHLARTIAERGRLAADAFFPFGKQRHWPR